MKFGWSNFYRSNFPGNFPLLEINQGVVKGMPLHSRVSLEIIFKKLMNLDRSNWKQRILFDVISRNLSPVFERGVCR